MISASGAGLAQFYQDHSIGVVYEDSEITVFFGDRRSKPEAVAAAFPDFSLSVLKQTHSDLVVHSPTLGTEPVEADAHFTRSRRVALCVRTADCMPVLIFDPSSRMVAAIHAGWRGVENEIVRKTCQRLVTEGASLTRARAWIGPHIGAESFEVGADVGRSLEKRFEAVRGFSSENTSLRPHADPEKVRVDLLAIVRAQLASSGIERERVLVIPTDTVQSLAHESYRRDKSASGRQISFIALK